MAANPERRRYSFEQYVTLLRNSEQLASLNTTVQVSEIYRRLSIPLEKRTIVPLEVIEPTDEEDVID